MKALVLAAALAALSTTALAGAARDERQPTVTDTTTASVIADAGRLGSAHLTSLNGGSPWTPASHQADADFGTLTSQVDPGTLLLALGVVGLLLSRAIGRTLRRLEQQRRATALASTLGHEPHA